MLEKIALARHLKEERARLGQSQEEFAAACGISKEILSRMERGKANPRLATLQSIAAYTDKTVAELLKVSQADIAASKK